MVLAKLARWPAQWANTAFLLYRCLDPLPNTNGIRKAIRLEIIYSAFSLLARALTDPESDS